MSERVQITEPESLWVCLHDGYITSLDSDLMARTLTLVVDAPYHWDFHQLASETRFKIVGENVRIAEAFDFEPWLGATEPSRETPWKDAQEQRMKDYQKGRLSSLDWSAFVSQVNIPEAYQVMSAELTNNQQFTVLELGVMGDPNYYTVRIHAERFRFYVGERELLLKDFQDFGDMYWEHFAQKSKATSAENQSL